MTKGLSTGPVIVYWKDIQTTAIGWFVIDQLIHGVCGGGIFIHAQATEKEVTELAHTMTYKNTLQRIPFGGAKAGICYDHTKEDAAEVLARFIHFLKPWLETVWCTGADLNTTNQSINAVIGQLKMPSMFDALGKMIAQKLSIKNQSEAIFLRMMDIMTPYFTLSEGATGYSVSQVIAELVVDVAPRVFIQGFGTVGRSLAYFLHQWNIGKVVGISDKNGVLYCDEGIDVIEVLNAYFQAPGKDREDIDRWVTPALRSNYHFQKRVSHQPDEAYFIEALSAADFNVLSPCAHRYAITEAVMDAIPRSSDVYLISGSNNVFDSASTKQKAVEKGIRYVPEWLSNCGNAILYEELLAVSTMPADSQSYFQHRIRHSVLSFIQGCHLENHPCKNWESVFKIEAEKRIAQATTASVYDIPYVKA